MPNYVGQTALIPAPAFGTETMSAVQRAKASMFTNTAEGSFLSAVGQNYGVPRPQLTINDDLYRQLIQLLAWQPKTILFTLYKLMGIVFGSQASIIVAGDRPWRIYEVNPNEIIIELPTSLIAGSNETGTYLHGWYGVAAVPAGPSDTFTTTGDVTTSSATTLVGKTLYTITPTGTVTTYTIVTATYDEPTDTSTIEVSAATLPTGGVRFWIDIPGDGTASYRGDFLAPSGFTGTFATAAGPDTDTIEVTGDASLDLSVDHTVVLVYEGALHEHVIDTISYDSATGITTIVMTAATIPGGLTAETLYHLVEAADTSTTADHDDRVYLSALGAYEIVAYYLDLLVRAAGIVVRLEQV